MTYLMTSNTDGDLGTFRQIVDRVGAPPGMIARYAGENEHGLAITTVWETKAACDRFTAEQLIPALTAVLGDPLPAGATSAFVTFEVIDQHVSGGAS